MRMDVRGKLVELLAPTSLNFEKEVEKNAKD